MAFIEILNSKLLYILVILGIGFILVFSLLTLFRSYKHALDIGMDKTKIKGIITSSMIFSIILASCQCCRIILIDLNLAVDSICDISKDTHLSIVSDIRIINIKHIWKIISRYHD